MQTRGRPRKIDHLAVARDYLVRHHDAETVAKIHGVGRATVFRAVKTVETSDHPEAEVMRRLTGIRRPA